MVLAPQVEAKKVDGKLVIGKDTMDVIFNIPFKLFGEEPNYEKLQYKVKYYNSIGNKITVIPDNAKEFWFTYEGEFVRMLSRKNTIGLGSIFNVSSNIFLRLEMEGAVNLFNYYETRSSPGMYGGAGGAMVGGYSYGVDSYILQKGNGELKKPKGLSFKKDMADYFSDCPELAEKIEKKDFRKNDLEEIVRFYNSSCK
jgi:hypothetical protein